MNSSIKVMPNQSMADVILQSCGSLEAGMKVMADNDKSISDYPNVGDVITIDSAGISAYADTGVLQYLRQNDIVIGTLGDIADVECTILLKPVMHVVPRTLTPPAITGRYEFNFQAASGFINVYPIPHTYYPLATPVLTFITEDRYIAGEMPAIAAGMDGSGSGLPYMDALLLAYSLDWVVGRGFMLAWSDMAMSVKTATFIDINGNEAYASPLIALDNITQTVVEYMIANLDVELVSASHGMATLRLTRSHNPVAHSDFVTQVMSWIEDAAGGSPDPLDPTNPDKTILVLPRGKYTFGVSTLYINAATIYPASAFTEVVEIS
jgi:hypothetical protein